MSYSVSEMKALKRARSHGLEWVPDPYDPNDDSHEPAGYYQLKSIPRSGPHAPNKKESQLLRSICSRTGLTEEEVRKHRVYRQQLARVATPLPSTRHPDFRVTVRVRRQVTDATGLHPHQPRFLEAFTTAWTDHLARWGRWYSPRRPVPEPLTASQALTVSLQKRR